MFRELLRKNNEISITECIRILKTEKRGVLSVNGDKGYPYGMPMNHWYNEEDGKIYFHCGKAGHRLDALQKDSKVSFCVYDECKQKDTFEKSSFVRSAGIMKFIVPQSKKRSPHLSSSSICRSDIKPSFSFS